MSEALDREVAELMKLARAAASPEERARRERMEEQERIQLDAAGRARAMLPERIDFWLRCSGVPERHRELEIREDLIPPAIRAWAAGFPQSIKGASAIIAGPTGTGKTTAAIWALIQAYRAGSMQNHEWSCPSMRFVSSPELFGRVFAKEPLEKFELCDLLVIDDWGMAYETDWPLAAMDRLVDRRWSENRATIVTTNLHPLKNGALERPEETFEARYPRVFSRLADASGPGVVALARADMRRPKAVAR